MKMTLQEVKDEMKDIEGNPEVKKKIRQNNKNSIRENDRERQGRCCDN